MGVFGRDFDVIDNTLPESMRNATITVANVIGSIILITVFEKYFIIVRCEVVVNTRVLMSARSPWWSVSATAISNVTTRGCVSPQSATRLDLS